MHEHMIPMHNSCMRMYKYPHACVCTSHAISCYHIQCVLPFHNFNIFAMPISCYGLFVHDLLMMHGSGPISWVAPYSMGMKQNHDFAQNLLRQPHAWGSALTLAAALPAYSLTRLRRFYRQQMASMPTSCMHPE